MKRRWIIWGLWLFLTAAGFAQVSELQVSGTMKYQGERIAYINGEMMRVGDECGPFRLVGVGDDHVQVKEITSGDQYLIRIGQPPRLMNEAADVQTESLPAAEAVNDTPSEMYITKVEQSAAKEEEAETRPPEKGNMVKALFVFLVVGVGFLTSFIGNIWFLVEAFKESVWWGVGCLFLPVVPILFLFMHWDAAGKPFGLSLLGSAMAVIAVLSAPEFAYTLP